MTLPEEGAVSYSKQATLVVMTSIKGIWSESMIRPNSPSNLSSKFTITMARKGGPKITLFLLFISIIAFGVFVPVFAPLPSLSSSSHSHRHRKVFTVILSLALRNAWSQWIFFYSFSPSVKMLNYCCRLMLEALR